MTDKEKLSNKDLLKVGMQGLDMALQHIMEMEGAGGQALAHFIHAALTFGETLLSSVDDQ